MDMNLVVEDRMTDLLKSNDELLNELAAAYVGVACSTWNKWRSLETRKPPENRDPKRWAPYRKIGKVINYKVAKLDELKQRQTIA
jgi:hypothetical protein